ncbi:MAG: hypothetical protein M0R22_11560 [Dehalococcoidia bacterium]|jgi:hypothetical protein|nr:hypothetical protein [Dehalococcoidia bacterium]
MTLKRYLLPALNTIGLLVMLTLNGLANALPINGMTTGEVSDKYDNLFVPAGLTFSIWGLIYLLLTAFVVYQWMEARGNSGSHAFVEKVGAWFFVSCLANAGWILAWHYGLLPLSVLLMLVLLACLLSIYLRLRVGLSGVTRGERYFVSLPFSVYLGWITVATIANVSALLVSVDWNALGLGEQFWAVAVIAIAIAIALAMAFRRGDVYFCAVVDWALAGILLKRVLDTTKPDLAVMAATMVGIVIISAAIIVLVALRHVYRPVVS